MYRSWKSIDYSLDQPCGNIQFTTRASTFSPMSMHYKECNFAVSPGLQGDSTSPSWRRAVLSVHWKDWCWIWNSNTLATSCKDLTQWKRPWCWEGLGAEGEGHGRWWDDWMPSQTLWEWVWVDSRSCDGQGGLGVLWFMGSQRVRHSWVTELNWNELLRPYHRTRFVISPAHCCLSHYWAPILEDLQQILNLHSVVSI